MVLGGGCAGCGRCEGAPGASAWGEGVQLPAGQERRERRRGPGGLAADGAAAGGLDRPRGDPRAAGADPLFLQVKEATASVLEPYVRKSRYRQHGERVVLGQRMMQAASDIYLGWTKGLDVRRNFY